jgi:hypothetical protein
MAQSITPIFPNKGDQSLAIYDKLDAETGAGYATYYAINAATKTFNKQTIASQIPIAQLAVDDTAFTTVSEIDWDLTYADAAILAKAPVIVSASMEDTVASNAGMECRMNLEVLHVTAAGVETSLGTVTGTAASIGANATKSARLTEQVTPSAVRKLKIGEKLRVTTTFQARRTGAGSSATWRVWTDGASRGSTTNNQVDPTATTADLGYKNSTDIKILVGYKPIL